MTPPPAGGYRPNAVDGLVTFWAFAKLHWLLTTAVVVLVFAAIGGVLLLDKKVRLKSLQKSQKFCRTCGGTGKSDGKKCELCNGTGVPPVCPICDGDGRVEAEKRCSYCMGTGVVVS